MPNLEEHSKRTPKRYGVEGRDIHEWLDEPSRKYGGAHRQFRHDTKTIRLVGEIFGVDEEEIVSYDEFQQRIAGITSQTIRPSILVRVEQYWVGDKMIIQIIVPKGSEPVYYVRNIPYIRALTTSRPAAPLEVKTLHMQHFIGYLRNAV
ncbi:MAG: helix-turn-helix domain-containing protein [Asgard group archaeon]